MMATRATVAGAPPVAHHDEGKRAHDKELYALPLVDGVTQEQCRWTAWSRDGAKSAVRTGKKELTIVHHGNMDSMDAGASRKGLYDRTNLAAEPTAAHHSLKLGESQPSENTTLTLPHAIVDFAFSNCGGFLAIADANGALHLFKSQKGPSLFAYPIVAPSASPSRDTIEAVVFALSSERRGETPCPEHEDLLVLTRAGVLIRLGNLRLSEIERTLTKEASHNSALRMIMASIQVQQVQVGKLRDGSKSILLARRYSRSLFVTIANHSTALSVWRAETSNTQKADQTMKRHAAYDLLPDAMGVMDIQLTCQGRYLAVLSSGGSLTWWDWRGLVLLFQLNVPNIEAFASLEARRGSPQDDTSCILALYRRHALSQLESDAPTVELVEVRPHARAPSSEITSCSFSTNQDSTRVTLLSSPHPSDKLFITQVRDDSIHTFVINPLESDADRMELDDSQADNNTNSQNVSDGVRCAQELLAIMDFSIFQDSRVTSACADNMEKCLHEIGRDLEDSRIITESLVEFAKRIRHISSHASSSSSSYSSGTILEPRVFEWLDRIATTSYKWTTFTLLLSTSSGNTKSAKSVMKRWRAFCSANLLEVMCSYMQRGMIRAVSLLWQRHVHQDAVHHIGPVLRHLPMDLPFAAYEKWLQRDVIPSIVKFMERQTDHISATAGHTVKAFASWVVERIEHFAEKEDIATGLQLCALLRPRAHGSVEWGDVSTNSSLQWASLRFSSTASNEQDGGRSALERINHLAQQLEHMKYLQEHHGFKISLSVFVEETPNTIAMSILDRCSSAEAMPFEIRDHVATYLRYCGQLVDPVLLDYITEVLESSPTTSNTSEQARLLAIVDAIGDVEIRAKATLLFFGSLLPPFSSQVKQFTIKCVTWDTRQIDVIQEHVRLMEIQDMLTGYGVAHFKVGDPRSGSRLVSHILAQISRDAAFGDALQLVRAYSHLSVERAALQYFENLLTLEPTAAMGNNSSTSAMDHEISRRSRLTKATIRELKAHYAARSGDAWKILPVMEETLALGLLLLEMKETEEDQQRGKPQSSRADGWSSAFFLGILEATAEVFLAESAELEMPAAEDGNLASGADLSGESVLHARLLSDLQRIRRMQSEWGVLVSVKTLSDPEAVAARVRAFIQPDAMFTTMELAATSAKPGARQPAPTGKGKKRALGTMTDGVPGSFKRAKPLPSVNGTALTWNDEQRDDRQTTMAFDLHRYATHMGMASDEYQSLVAQVAAEHGDILKAVQYSRDLFSRRRGGTTITTRRDGNIGSSIGRSCASGLALKNISLSISKYTATHAEQIYTVQSAHGYGHAHDQHQQPRTPIQVAHMQAPMYSLELLRYAICVCDTDSFEETYVLLKSATLLNDMLRFTQLGNGHANRVDFHEEQDKWRIYGKWFREDTMCVLPSAQTMNLATRFAIAEHRLLITHGESSAMGIDSSSSIPSQELLASKRFVSFLVENDADLLSLQVILSMRWVSEDALTVIQTQLGKLLSTVFQSRRIDNFFGLGLMLSMDQREAFKTFRGQISKENVAKDFNRFQQFAKIGADAARAWQQIAFLHQCVELEGNARWWHYLNLLEIQCDHKAFQSERRDLTYIRTLVPELLAKSSYDYYTIQEFTRHYQIEDSFPALVYVEALLTTPEASSMKCLEYQDKVVGVLEDIHDQRLVALLLKVLPKMDGMDYERLLFTFRLLLEHTSYADKEEVERRIEVLHVLKAFAVSDRVASSSGAAVPVNQKAMAATTIAEAKREDTAEAPVENKNKICFHRMMAKPRNVLSEVLTTKSFGILSNLVLPLRLEPDELLMLLLKNVVDRHRKQGDAVKTDAPLSSSLSSSLSGSELERLFGILASLKAVESKITAGEWLAEHLPISAHKLRSLEFALEAAVASSTDYSGSNGSASGASSNTTFLGMEALTRLEQKALRVRLQLIFAESNLGRFFNETRQAELLTLAIKQPKELFYEMYRSTSGGGTSSKMSPVKGDRAQHDISLHKIADRVAKVLQLPAHEMRSDLVRELLVQDAVYGTSQKQQKQYERDDGYNNQKKNSSVPLEDIFTPLEEEQRDARDEQIIHKISYIAAKVADATPDSEAGAAAVALVEYLVTFARDTKPRAGVTFRAKLRAARTVLHLAQSHRSVVVTAVETKMKLAAFDVVVKELVDYIRNCKHMVVFEEHRVPYEIDFVIRAKKEALVRSLLRQHGTNASDAWVLRCVSNLMLDFDVQAPDLWEFALSKMMQLGMFRSLSRVLSGLSQQPFVRSISDADKVWEATLLSPLIRLTALMQESANSSKIGDDAMDMVESTIEPRLFQGVALEMICSKLERMVTMLQKCPFLDQIDVASFVVYLRDLTVMSASQSELANVDLYSYAVRCAMVIPRPSARLEALQRIIQAGAYIQVLEQVCDASVLLDEQPASLGGDAFFEGDDEMTEQLGLLQAIFTEAAKRNECDTLLGTPFEPGFLEFLAATGNIDGVLALLLDKKRLEAATTLVELFYESHPDHAPPDFAITDVSGQVKSSNRWKFLQQYVAASTASCLAAFR